MDATQQRPAERERNLSVAPLRLRVGPVSRLFGCDSCWGRYRNGRVPKEVLLVTRRLQLKPGEEGIVRPHPAGAAVLDRQSAVPVEDAI